MTVEGRAARGARGTVIERRVPIRGLGDAYIRPLQYGDSVRFYENRERDVWMLAGLFRRSVAGFESCTHEDVRAMVAGLPGLLEYAVVSASGLLQSEREADALASAAGGDDDDLYAGHDVPEPRAMKPEKGSPNEEATATLDEFEESDLIAFLHGQNYRYDEIYRLLPDEIHDLREGVERMQERKKRQRRKQQRSNTSGETAGAYQRGTEEPPGTAPEYR